MFLPYLESKRAFACPISRKVFAFKTPREKPAAFRAQQAHTASVIEGLDGEFHSGIRGALRHYQRQYNRLHGSGTATTGSLVQAA